MLISSSSVCTTWKANITYNQVKQENTLKTNSELKGKKACDNHKQN